MPSGETLLPFPLRKGRLEGSQCDLGCLSKMVDPISETPPHRNCGTPRTHEPRDPHLVGLSTAFGKWDNLLGTLAMPKLCAVPGQHTQTWLEAQRWLVAWPYLWGVSLD